MKYAFIREHEACFEVQLMCQMLSVSRSGYYAFCNRKPSGREQANQVLDAQIQKIHSTHKGRYGSPRIHRELEAQGNKCGRHRVARRLQVLGLKAKPKKRFMVTTDSRHNLPVAPNLLERDFTATAINQKWVGDITYIWTTDGWMYLATIIDLYSRAVIGWSLQDSMPKELVCDALLMALWRRGFPKDVIVHSDRGSQYCSDVYQQLIKDHSLKCSMSRKGDCWDNAVAESFFHTLKTELIYELNYKTKGETKQNIFEYLEVYYNRNRRHSSIGYQTPYEFENQLQNVS